MFDLEKKIKDYITKGKIKLAIDELKKIVDDKTNLIILEAQYNQIKNDIGLIADSDKDVKTARINSALLNILYDYCDDNKNTIMNTDNKRSIYLKEKIANNYERLSEWEEKRDLAENPNEKARCNNEIKSIKKQIDEYKKELANI